MQMSDMHPGRLVVLSPEECWDLVRSRPIGRIAWSGAEGLTVTPVNYSVADGHILLRTTPYSLLARDCSDREVAFEVDDHDAELHSGWSVLLRGRSQREDRMTEGTEVWVTGPRTLGIRIDVRSVSGRRVEPPAGR